MLKAFSQTQVDEVSQAHQTEIEALRRHTEKIREERQEAAAKALADAQAKTFKFVKEVGGKYYQRYMPWQIRSALEQLYTKAKYYAKKAYKQVCVQLLFVRPCLLTEPSLRWWWWGRGYN